MIRGTIVFSMLVAMPALCVADLREQGYLPEVVQHLERAKLALDMERFSIALAHTRVLLHDDGLEVYIDTSEAPDALRQDCLDAATKAIRFWNATVDPQMLRLVDRAEDADVRVVFKSRVELQGVEVGGYCLNTRSVVGLSNGNATGEFSATIYARFTQSNGTPMSAAHLQNIVTHEFGHVFGLNDEAKSKGLMGPLNIRQPRLDLNKEELEAVKRLREEVQDLRRRILARMKAR